MLLGLLLLQMPELGHGSILTSCKKMLHSLGNKITRPWEGGLGNETPDPIEMAKLHGLEVHKLGKARNEAQREMDNIFHKKPVGEIFTLADLPPQQQQNLLLELDFYIDSQLGDSGFSSIIEAKKVAQVKEEDNMHTISFNESDHSITGSYYGTMKDQELYGIPNSLKFQAPELNIVNAGGAFLVVTKTSAGYPYITQYRLFATKKQARDWIARYDRPEIRNHLKRKILATPNVSESKLFAFLFEQILDRHPLSNIEEGRIILAGIYQLKFEMFEGVMPPHDGINIRLLGSTLQVMITSEEEADPEKLLRKFVNEKNFQLLKKYLMVISPKQEYQENSQGITLPTPLVIVLNIPLES